MTKETAIIRFRQLVEEGAQFTYEDYSASPLSKTLIDAWADRVRGNIRGIFNKGDSPRVLTNKAATALINVNRGRGEEAFNVSKALFTQALQHAIEDLETNIQVMPVEEDTATPIVSNKVFVVHGHDEKVRETVARFIERLELEAVILHEQANQGATIIEKFERHADVSFAVVLLTPDDVGTSISEMERVKEGEFDLLKHRARQNVVLELGYFIARLGRANVCAINAGVEIPSDYLGVVYVPLDETGAWKFQLVKELKTAGLEFDLNRAM